MGKSQENADHMWLAEMVVATDGNNNGRRRQVSWQRQQSIGRGGIVIVGIEGILGPLPPIQKVVVVGGPCIHPSPLPCQLSQVTIPLGITH